MPVAADPTSPSLTRSPASPSLVPSAPQLSAYTSDCVCTVFFVQNTLLSQHSSPLSHPAPPPPPSYPSPTTPSLTPLSTATHPPPTMTGKDRPGDVTGRTHSPPDQAVQQAGRQQRLPSLAGVPPGGSAVVPSAHPPGVAVGHMRVPPAGARKAALRKRKQASDPAEPYRLLSARKNSWASRARRPARERVTQRVLTAGGTRCHAQRATKVAARAAAAAAVAACIAGRTAAGATWAGYQAATQVELKLTVTCLACRV